MAEACPVEWGASMVTDVLNQAFLPTSMLVSHRALAGAGRGPAMFLAAGSTSSPRTAAFSATLVTVCTPVALGGIRALQPRDLQNINVHQPHITLRNCGYFVNTQTFVNTTLIQPPYSDVCAHTDNSAVFSW